MIFKGSPERKVRNRDVECPGESHPAINGFCGKVLDRPLLIDRFNQVWPEEDEWGMCCLWKMQWKIPNLIAAAHSSLIKAAKAVTPHQAGTDHGFSHGLCLPGQGWWCTAGWGDTLLCPRGCRRYLAAPELCGQWGVLALVTPVLEAAGCSPRAVRLLAGGTIKHCDPACLQQETMRWCENWD